MPFELAYTELRIFQRIGEWFLPNHNDSEIWGLQDAGYRDIPGLRRPCALNPKVMLYCNLAAFGLDDAEEALNIFPDLRWPITAPNA